MIEVLLVLSLVGVGFEKDWIEVKQVKSGEVRIDGKADEVWNVADSVLIIRQFYPYYGSTSTYPTVAKVLQDDGNLYFLFITNYRDMRPSTSLSGHNESYTVYLDPLLSRVSGYYFTVTSSGERDDGMVLEDGRRVDGSWDGVWDSKVGVFQDKQGNWFLFVEFKILFKNLRFAKDKNVWGVQFAVYCDEKRETSYWILPDKDEEIRVSKFGLLKGVSPRVVGSPVEFYPVALVKNTYSAVTDSSRIGEMHPWAGIDVTFRKEASTLNLTILPDFAEIESDPFAISLEKYEIYYSERRPFFLEGAEIFEAAGFGNNYGFYRPAKVFYSRRIGRRLRDGSGEVPILFGLKYAGKLNRWELGFLSCLTDRKFGVSDSAWKTSWNVFRAKKYFSRNSEIGIIQTYKKNLEKNYWAMAFDIDGALRWNKSQVAWQVVMNRDTSENAGCLLQGGAYLQMNENWSGILKGSFANDYFDVSPMGYAKHSPGDKELITGINYMNFSSKGKVSFYNVFLGGVWGKEKEDEFWSRNSYFEVNANLREPASIGLHLSVGYGKDCDQGVVYTGKSGNFNAWASIKKLSVWAGGLAQYWWNYRRSFLAWQGTIWGGMGFPLSQRLSTSFNLDGWIEFDTTGHHLATTVSSNVYLTYSFTPFMEFSVASNPVLIKEDGSRWNLYQVRAAVYYSWEIKPRSTLYIVLNQLFNRNDTGFETAERIYAVKVKWLFW